MLLLLHPSSRLWRARARPSLSEEARIGDSCQAFYSKGKTQLLRHHPGNCGPQRNPHVSSEFIRRSSLCPSHSAWTRQRERPLRSFALLPVDPWAPGAGVDSQSIASALFAASLFPYLLFLYFLTKSGSAPRLTLFGFYFLLAFVAATIPAGIYAKVHYGTSLSNVDYLHGGAESLLTVTNLLIVLGLREALKAESDKANASAADSEGVAESPEKEPLESSRR